MICAKCGKENAKATMFRKTGTTIIIGKYEHFLCHQCYTKWCKFLRSFLPQLHKISGTPKWSELWEEIYTKFLYEGKERVEFT
jgi:hypothetical protein